MCITAKAVTGNFFLDYHFLCSYDSHQIIAKNKISAFACRIGRAWKIVLRERSSFIFLWYEKPVLFQDRLNCPTYLRTDSSYFVPKRSEEGAFLSSFFSFFLLTLDSCGPLACTYNTKTHSDSLSLKMIIHYLLQEINMTRNTPLWH